MIRRSYKGVDRADDELDLRMLRLLKSGLSYREAAYRLGMTKNVVIGRVRKIRDEDVLASGEPEAAVRAGYAHV